MKKAFVLSLVSIFILIGSQANAQEVPSCTHQLLARYSDLGAKIISIQLATLKGNYLTYSVQFQPAEGPSQSDTEEVTLDFNCNITNVQN